MALHLLEFKDELLAKNLRTFWHSLMPTIRECLKSINIYNICNDGSTFALRLCLDYRFVDKFIKQTENSREPNE